MKIRIMKEGERSAITIGVSFCILVINWVVKVKIFSTNLMERRSKRR